MSLYQGKYRRTCCATKQPPKPGPYMCWYRKNDGERAVINYWNGKEWLFTKNGGSRTAFGNIRSMQVLNYWAPIPKGLLKA